MMLIVKVIKNNFWSYKKKRLIRQSKIKIVKIDFKPVRAESVIWDIIRMISKTEEPLLIQQIVSIGAFPCRFTHWLGTICLGFGMLSQLYAGSSPAHFFKKRLLYSCQMESKLI